MAVANDGPSALAIHPRQCRPENCRCQPEVEHELDLHFPLTSCGHTAEVACPAGHQGLVTRRCSNDGVWQLPMTKCTSLVLTKIVQEVIDDVNVVDVASQLQGATARASLLSSLDVSNAVGLFRQLVEKSSTNTSLLAKPLLAVVRNMMAVPLQVIRSSILRTDGNAMVGAIETFTQRLAVNLQLRPGDNDFVTDLGTFQLRIRAQSCSTAMASFNVALAAIELPLARACSQLDGFVTLHSVYYADPRLFQSASSVGYIAEAGTLLPNIPVIMSAVFALTVDGAAPVFSAADPVVYRLNHPTLPDFAPKRSCVFWVPATSRWDSQGCAVQSSSPNETICQCTHLTNFAVLAGAGSGSLSDSDKLALDVISIIGLGISLPCLLFVAFTYLWFKVSLCVY